MFGTLKRAPMPSLPLPGKAASAITVPAPPARPALVDSTDQTVRATPVACIRGGLPPKALRRVREYIDAHLGEKVSIDMLAGVAGLSPFYFARAFKKSEGVTPHDYLIRRRVERTMELLAGTDLALSEIAIAAGFSDQSHCARRFREHVGVCPHDYRWSTR
jgi:AraC-like DNA-binding protein